MNAQANAMAESAVESQVRAPAHIPATRHLYWSVRRELWENRSIYLAPLAAAALFVLGFAISVVRLPGQMRAAAALDPIHQREAIAMPFDIVAGLLMITAMIVGAFYCLDALYGERRDRSTLFWKSLPVSDLTTVLAKTSIPLVILPLVTFAITAVTQFIMLMVSSAVLVGSGQSVATLWSQLSFFRMSLLLLYHLVTVHALWPAPLYAWLLLVSAWARRAPFVWAFLPPLAICYLEKIAFNTAHFLALLQHRLEGSGMEALIVSGTFPMDPMTQLTPGRFLSAPGLWIGLAVTAAFLAAAVRLRRYRGPI
ncbi:MAG TPA: ABC transporter permease [Terriglobales bacterium]|nr:ABC transporter permease [Terriglobales bacterium]